MPDTESTATSVPFDKDKFLKGDYVLVEIREIEKYYLDEHKSYFSCRYALYKDKNNNQHYAVNLDDPLNTEYIGDYNKIGGFEEIIKQGMNYYFPSNHKKCEDSKALNVLDNDLIQYTTSCFIKNIKNTPAFKAFYRYANNLRNPFLGTADAIQKKKGDQFCEFLNSINKIKTPEELNAWREDLMKFSEKFNENLQPRVNKWTFFGYTMTFFGYTFFDFTATKKSTRSYQLLKQLKKEAREIKLPILPKTDRSFIYPRQLKKQSFSEWFNEIRHRLNSLTNKPGS